MRLLAYTVYIELVPDAYKFAGSCDYGDFCIPRAVFRRLVRTA